MTTRIQSAIREAIREQTSRAARTKWRKFRETATAQGVDPDAALSLEMSRRRRVGMLKGSK